MDLLEELHELREASSREMEDLKPVEQVALINDRARVDTGRDGSLAGVKLAREVLVVIEAGEGSWTNEANRHRLRLGLEWADVVEVARTSDSWKRATDEKGQALDGFKDAVTGRDRRGRPLYLAGKQVYLEGEVRWHVITFHEDDRS